MKRAVLCAVLLLAWLAARPEAVADACLQKNPCKVVTCGFMASLNLAHALMRSIALLPASTTRSQAAIDAYANRALANHEKQLKEYRKCYLGVEGFEVPVYAVTGSTGCAVKPSLEEALATSDACREAVDAEHARAVRAQSLCQRGPVKTAAALKARHIVAAQTGIDSLEARLGDWLSSCAPDAEMSKQLADLGLEELMKQGEAARNAPPAKRAVPKALDPIEIWDSFGPWTK